MTGFRNTVVFLLCFLLFALSAEATLTHQKVQKRDAAEAMAAEVVEESTASVHSHKTKDSKKDDDDDDEDDDDDDDDEDDEKKATPKIKQARVFLSAAPQAPAPAAPADPKAEKLAEAEEELEKNQDEQESLKQKIAEMSDASKSQAELTEMAKLTANETQSPAMAAMLEGMWSEMRMFNVPMYLDRLKEDQKDAKDEEKHLKAKIKKLKDAKEGSSDDEDEKDDSDKEGDDEKKVAGGKKGKDKNGKYIAMKEHEAELQARASQGNQDFAMGTIVAICILSSFVMCVSSANAIVSKNTWDTLDGIIVHFLAISWFIVVNHGFDYYNFQGFMRVFAHLSLAMLFLMAFIQISWSMHKQPERVSVFEGIFTPMCIWVNVGFLKTVQEHNVTPVGVAMNTSLMLVGYGLISFIFYNIVAKTCERTWGDGIVDKVIGHLAGAGFVLWTHLVLTGAMSPIAGPNPNPPSMENTVIMLVASAVYLVLGIVALPVVDRTEKRIHTTKYWNSRCLQVLSAMLGFLPHFSFAVSLGHLIIGNLGYHDGAVAARLFLCVANTIVAFALIFIAAARPENTNFGKLMVGLGGFIGAAAWAGLLNNSIDQMLAAGGYAHPFPIKLALTGFVSAFVYPTYSFYLKPIIMTKG